MLRTTVLLLVGLLIFPLAAEAAQIKGPLVKVRENSVVVSASLSLDEAQLREIEKGVSKEIVFYFDLFRGWRVWPDEFIIGKSFTQTLHCDPVKKEYIATSLSGNRLREKRFSSCRDMIRWALTVPDFTLTNINELEPSEYVVKVTVESRLRRLPPFIDLLFFFVKDKEFKIKGESAYFPLNVEQ